MWKSNFWGSIFLVTALKWKMAGAKKSWRSIKSGQAMIRRHPTEDMLLWKKPSKISGFSSSYQISFLGPFFGLNRIFSSWFTAGILWLQFAPSVSGMLDRCCYCHNERLFLSPARTVAVIIGSLDQEHLELRTSFLTIYRKTAAQSQIPKKWDWI